jgi:hypothetical protein
MNLKYLIYQNKLTMADPFTFTMRVAFVFVFAFLGIAVLGGLVGPEIGIAVGFIVGLWFSFT